MNLQKMLQEAQKLQKKLKEFDNQIFDYNYKNLVSFKMSGLGVMSDLVISKDLIDKDDPDTLQDVLVLAINEARQDIEAKKEKAQNALTGQMPKGFF